MKLLSDSRRRRKFIIWLEGMGARGAAGPVGAEGETEAADVGLRGPRGLTLRRGSATPADRGGRLGRPNQAARSSELWNRRRRGHRSPRPAPQSWHRPPLACAPGSVSRASRVCGLVESLFTCCLRVALCTGRGGSFCSPRIGKREPKAPAVTFWLGRKEPCPT